ncbi:MAG TPA: hypothetical protein VGB32_05115 [Candidatus Bathyarchaeia archaeon]
MAGKKLFSTTNLVTLALIVGLGSGFYVNYTLTNPKINGLTSDLEQKTSLVASLQTQLGALQANYTEALGELTQVTQSYNDLAGNSIALSEYEELEESYQDMSNELEELQLTNQILVDENHDLSIEYVKLMEKYNELRVPSWTYFVVNNLRVNLTVTSNTYPYNIPITGTVNIRHLNGSPFTGRIQLLVWSDYWKNGKTSPTITVSGSTQYSIEAPFNSGPGTYYLLVSNIEDLSGTDIATYNDLLSFRVKLQMG